MSALNISLCDDIMELIGEQVEVKRTRDTLDYWCEIVQQPRTLAIVLQHPHCTYRDDIGKRPGGLVLDGEISRFREEWMPPLNDETRLSFIFAIMMIGGERHQSGLSFTGVCHRPAVSQVRHRTFGITHHLVWRSH